jgi:hypothetical protein
MRIALVVVLPQSVAMILVNCSLAIRSSVYVLFLVSANTEEPPDAVHAPPAQQPRFLALVVVQLAVQLLDAPQQQPTYSSFSMSAASSSYSFGLKMISAKGR